MPSRADVVEEARTWLKVKWLHQGRTRLGIDCAGLVIKVGNELGLLDGYDYTNYQRRTNGTAFLNEFKANMTYKPLVDAAPGDVMLFRDSIFPCHSTIVGNRGPGLTIIHAHAPDKRVVEGLLDQGDWLDRRVACFEYKGLTDG